MNLRNYLVGSVGLFISVASCESYDIIGEQTEVSFLKERQYAGGETTVFLRTSEGFETPMPNLTPSEFERHANGDEQFEQRFVSSPSPINPGLGSVFNNSSCISCHLSDGRAGFPKDIQAHSGLLVRISTPGKDSHGGPVAAEGFGLQVQNHAIYRQVAEAEYSLRFETYTETLSDGTDVDLRKPIISLTNPYVSLPSDALLSPRIAPPVFGLGLLEVIPEADIISHQDIDDDDKDGISGKANYVWNPMTKRTELGRFGWKANTPNLLIQSAVAYNNDMGITSYVFPQESCQGQSNCESTDNEQWEISKEILDDVTFYVRTLAVPALANSDVSEVISGAKLFEKIACAKCHIPEMHTGISGIKGLSEQTIYPYTDMLLHDMGEGLADNRPDFLANGREWKTRPLWGIGLSQLVNGHTDFLHDGRARNLTEAILWHGGEAAKSKKLFKELPKKDRKNLLAFLNSL